MKWASPRRGRGRFPCNRVDHRRRCGRAGTMPGSRSTGRGRMRKRGVPARVAPRARREARGVRATDDRNASIGRQVRATRSVPGRSWSSFAPRWADIVQDPARHTRMRGPLPAGIGGIRGRGCVGSRLAGRSGREAKRAAAPGLGVSCGAQPRTDLRHQAVDLDCRCLSPPTGARPLEPHPTGTRPQVPGRHASDRST